MTAECFRCGGEATETFGNGYLCDECIPTGKNSSTSNDATDAGEESTKPRWRAWGDVDFSTTAPDTYPAELLGVEQWMGRVEKQPFSPWGGRDHPDAEADKDARYKWGISANYGDGETVAMAEDDPRLDGRVFIQRESDPFGHVDGWATVSISVPSRGSGKSTGR